MRHGKEKKADKRWENILPLCKRIVLGQAQETRAGKNPDAVFRGTSGFYYFITAWKPVLQLHRAALVRRSV